MKVELTEFPKSIFELIDTKSFRERPGMYLGQKNIDLLSAMIEGYQYAIDSYEILDDKSIRFEKFRDWVVNFYNAGEYTGSWKHLILDDCNGDSQKAVDTFFNLYDRFKAEE